MGEEAQCEEEDAELITPVRIATNREPQSRGTATRKRLMANMAPAFQDYSVQI